MRFVCAVRFLDQAPSLAHQAPLVVLLDAWDLDRAQHLILAARVGHERADHGLGVDQICLHTFDTAINQQAGWVDHEQAVSRRREAGGRR
jgi:hypothetical protein